MKNALGRSHGGFVLVLSLLTASVLLVLIVAYVSRVVTDYRLTSKIYNSNAAINLAEAGAERAVWEIVHNGSKFTGWTSTAVSGGTKYCLFANSLTTSIGKSIGEYDTEAIVPANGGSATITSWGYAPNKNSPDEQRKVMVTIPSPPPSSSYAYTRALGAVDKDGSITMSGQAYTDSYDSTLGSYASQPHTKNGDISTNGTINLSGQAYVNGDANPGPEHPLPDKPKPNVSGTHGTLQAPIIADPVPAINSTLENAAKISNSNGGITINGNPFSGTSISAGSSDNVVLPGGTTANPAVYYFTSISANGQSAINVNGPSIIYVGAGGLNADGQSNINFGSQTVFGPSTIYLDKGGISTSGQSHINVKQPLTTYVYGGNVNISGQGIVNSAKDPNNVVRPEYLLLYSTGSTISLSGQASFTGAIYAPSATVTLSGQESIYGSIICGSSVDTGQAAIHFDLSLKNVTFNLGGSSSSSTSTRVTSWQQIQ